MLRGSVFTMAAGAQTRRSQADRRAATRCALIDAAIRCVNDNGAATASTSDVAREAGVTRGALQHHFPSARELWLAVVVEAWESALNAYAHAPSVEVPLRPRLHGWVTASLALYDTAVGRAAIEILVAHRAEEDLIAGANVSLRGAEDRLHAQWSAAIADVVPDDERARRLWNLIRNHALGAYGRSIFSRSASVDTDALTEMVLTWITASRLGNQQDQV